MDPGSRARHTEQAHHKLRNRRLGIVQRERCQRDEASAALPDDPRELFVDHPCPGHGNLRRFDVHATSYFDVLQTAGVMFHRKTADEIERRIALVNTFEMARQQKEAIFLDEAPPASVLSSARNVTDERLALGKREIYVHFPSGQGQSKLKLSVTPSGTARNMNTIAKLAELAKELK